MSTQLIKLIFTKKKSNKMKVIKLKQIKQKKGNLLKIIKKDDSFLNSFGELYISEIKPYQIKAWRYHKTSMQNIFLIDGKCKIVCQKKKKFLEIKLSENSYKLVIIPKKCWYGFKNESSKKVRLLNLSDKKFSERDIIRKELNLIEYNW